MQNCNQARCFTARQLVCSIAMIAASCNPAHGQDALLQLIGSPNDQFAYHGGFVSIGDITGDGVDEFVAGFAGAQWHDVYSGSDWSRIHRGVFIGPNQYHSTHGASVAGIGDWNGDGIPDYAVGAPGYTPSPPVEWEGIVRIFSGADHSVLHEIAHHVHEEQLGTLVFGLGDITGDGWPEVAVQGSTSLGGHYWIYSAPSGTLLRSEYGGATRNDIHSVEDRDGDGIRDYICGATGGLNGPLGGVALRSGATGAFLLTCATRRADYAGASVAPAGDWNADGIGDFVCGAPGEISLQGYASLPQEVLVFSGADGSVLTALLGNRYVDPSARFGWSVDSGLDVNGDGFPDLIVGAPGWGQHPGSGTALLFSGRTHALLWRLEGDWWNDHVGRQVALLPDRDGDGLAEWLVNVPDDHTDHSVYFGLGSVTIYRGAAGDRWSSCGSEDTSPAAPSARLFAAGPISLRENALQLSVESAPAGAAALLLCAPPAAAAPFDAGRLCLGAPLVVVSALSCDATGAAWMPLDLHAPPFGPGPHRLQPGDTRAFQLVYRDPGNGRRDASDSMVIRFLP